MSLPTCDSCKMTCQPHPIYCGCCHHAVLGLVRDLRAEVERLRLAVQKATLRLIGASNRYEPWVEGNGVRDAAYVLRQALVDAPKLPPLSPEAKP